MSLTWDNGKIRIKQILSECSSKINQLHSVSKNAGLNVIGNGHLESSATKMKDIEDDLNVLVIEAERCLSRLEHVALSTPQKAQIVIFKEKVDDIKSDRDRVMTRFDMDYRRAMILSGKFNEHNDDDAQNLLGEREGLERSLEMLDQIQINAERTRTDLVENSFATRAFGEKIVRVGEKIPGINQLIQDIESAEVRQQLIVGFVLGCCLSFCLWWIFL